MFTSVGDNMAYNFITGGLKRGILHRRTEDGKQYCQSTPWEPVYSI